MESTTTLRVRYAETDQMGVAHHRNYLVWMELGRTDWLRQRGRTYAQWEDAGIRLPVTGIQVNYRVPARYDDLLTVRTWIKEAGRRKVIFGYRIEREGQRLAEGESVHMIADLNGRATVLPEEMLAQLA